MSSETKVEGEAKAAEDVQSQGLSSPSGRTLRARPPKVDAGNCSDGAPQPLAVGQTKNVPRMTSDGIVQDYGGTVSGFSESHWRLPDRWAVRWSNDSKTESVDEDIDAETQAGKQRICLEEEFLQEEIQDPSKAQPKIPLDSIQQRSHQIQEMELDQTNILSSLVLMAALEETLQAKLESASQEQEETKTDGKRHPPPYYKSNPSAYLREPGADVDQSESATSSSNSHTVELTLSSLANRIRTGCQWAYDYYSAENPLPDVFPPTSRNGDSSTVRRRTPRQVKPVLNQPKTPVPLPVQKGGRVAMWCLSELMGADKNDTDTASENVERGDALGGVVDGSDKGRVTEEADGRANAPADSTIEDDAVSPTKFPRRRTNGSKKPESNAQESPSDDDSMSDESESTADGDYSGNEESSNSSEELVNVRRESRRSSRREHDEKMMIDDAEDYDDPKDPEEITEDDVVSGNYYFRPSFLSFLEIIAKPRAVSIEDLQKAICDCLLRIKHNKEYCNFGLPTSSLLSFDEHAIGSDYESLGDARVVLRCLSGETYGTLQRLDQSSFSRCKFALELIGNDESATKLEAEQRAIMEDIQFKERKSFDKWRHKGIYEGHTEWPSWDRYVKEFISSKVDANAEATPEEGLAGHESEMRDSALAQDLAEEERQDRRRSRRGAASGGSDGVFYGNQSQLTLAQLQDAILRIVKSNPGQSLMSLLKLVADDSTDPVRRVRTAIGRLLWKRNLLVREPVSTMVTDRRPFLVLQERPLVRFENSGSTTLDGTSEEESLHDDEELESYIKYLHKTEFHLRALILANLTEIPLAVIASSADERDGTMESMDAEEFVTATNITWQTDGSDLVGKEIFRPAPQENSSEAAECKWYVIHDFTKSIASKSPEEDGEESHSPLVERRMRFRAVPFDAETPSKVNGNPLEKAEDVLVLTEAQVAAGMKAAELERKRVSIENISCSHPFSHSVGEKVALVPLNGSEGSSQTVPVRIAGINSELQSGKITHRTLILVDKIDPLVSSNQAFWATVAPRGDGETIVCQPDGASLHYMIEQSEYHVGSTAYDECMKIIEWLQRQGKAQPFLEPVDPVALNIPTYSTVVKEPMDISTVLERLKSGQYSKVPSVHRLGRTASPISKMLNGGFRKDLELIFDNAMLFNPPDDWIYQAASQLKKNVTKKILEACKLADAEFSSKNRGAHGSLYAEKDSNAITNDYDSDDNEFYGPQSRKRKRSEGRATTRPVRDDPSLRAIERPLTLQKILREYPDLSGPLAHLPINWNAATFSLPSNWSCRPASVREDVSSSDREQSMKSLEFEELRSLKQFCEEERSSSLRRSTRSNHSTHAKDDSLKNGIEYLRPKSIEMDDVIPEVPLTTRVDVEIIREKMHEDVYARLYKNKASRAVSLFADGFNENDGDEEPGACGMYQKGYFPPYLGSIIPTGTSPGDVSWEIRSSFVVPAIRWVIRGLIESGHLSATEPVGSAGGVVVANHVYYHSKELNPFEILDQKELLRRKRSNIDVEGDGSDDDDVELSSYEKARAERVARNAERLKALGLA